jgi:hypothetical protein
MILVRECEEIQRNIGVRVCLTACTLSHNVTRSHSTGSEQIYTPSPGSTCSNFTKICPMAQNMYVNFQVCSLLTERNKPCCKLGG